jgi:hypothetical protein
MMEGVNSTLIYCKNFDKCQCNPRITIMKRLMKTRKEDLRFFTKGNKKPLKDLSSRMT